MDIIFWLVDEFVLGFTTQGDELFEMSLHGWGVAADRKKATPTGSLA